MRRNVRILHCLSCLRKRKHANNVTIPSMYACVPFPIFDQLTDYHEIFSNSVTEVIFKYLQSVVTI